jgi:SAM-dependent methyltransferase
MTTTDAERDYILSTDDEELARRGLQHAAWRARGLELWRRAGFRAGDVVLDAGCGPGFATLDRATNVGRTGRVIACDRSARVLAHVQRECEHAGLGQVETRLAELADLDLGPGSLDGAWARWVFAWLPDPRPVLAAIAHALRPGATFAVLEYLDWAALRLVPESDAFERVVAACMKSWTAGGATIDVARALPTLAAEVGLELVHLEPVARAGRPGSLEWAWPTGFFASYLPRLVERGLLAEEDRARCMAELAARERAPAATHVLTPTVGEILFRRI